MWSEGVIGIPDAKYKRALKWACQFSTDPEQTKKAWLKQVEKEGKE